GADALRAPAHLGPHRKDRPVRDPQHRRGDRPVRRGRRPRRAAGPRPRGRGRRSPAPPRRVDRAQPGLPRSCRPPARSSGGALRMATLREQTQRRRDAETQRRDVPASLRPSVPASPRFVEHWPAVVAFLAVAVVWELAVRLTGTPSYLIPAPTAIVGRAL